MKLIIRLLAILAICGRVLVSGADEKQSLIPEGDPGRLDLRAIELRNPASQVKEWSDIRKFLEKSTAHEHSYEEGRYDCKHFALDLFREAQVNAIQSCLAILKYDEKPEGHCVVCFPTPDQGEIFVDFTPITTATKQIPVKGLVLAQTGMPLIHIPLEQVPVEFTNSPPTFLGYVQLQQSLVSARERLEKESASVAELSATVARLQQKEPQQEGARRRWAEDIEAYTNEQQDAQRDYEARKRVYLDFVQATRSPYDFKSLPTVRAILRF